MQKSRHSTGVLPDINLPSSLQMGTRDIVSQPHVLTGLGIVIVTSIEGDRWSAERAFGNANTIIEYRSRMEGPRCMSLLLAFDKVMLIYEVFADADNVEGQ